MQRGEVCYKTPVRLEKILCFPCDCCRSICIYSVAFEFSSSKSSSSRSFLRITIDLVLHLIYHSPPRYHLPIHIQPQMLQHQSWLRLHWKPCQFQLDPLPCASIWSLASQARQVEFNKCMRSRENFGNSHTPANCMSQLARPGILFYLGGGLPRPTYKTPLPIKPRSKSKKYHQPPYKTRVLYAK